MTLALGQTLVMLVALATLVACFVFLRGYRRRLLAMRKAIERAIGELHRGDLSVIVCVGIGVVVLTFTGW